VYTVSALCYGYMLCAWALFVVWLLFGLLVIVCVISVFDADISIGSVSLTCYCLLYCGTGMGLGGAISTLIGMCSGSCIASVI